MLMITKELPFKQWFPESSWTSLNVEPRITMTRALLPFSWLYASLMICRNKGFDWGLIRSERVGVPVISIGNISMGGTGKTPLVEYVVRRCLAKGKRVAIVSRGYKRASKGVVVVSDGRTVLLDARQGGDEPVQMARKFPQAMVVVGEQRVGAAKVAAQRLGAEVVVLDDGFQHRYLHRDLDVVVLDSTRDVTVEPIFPAGRRREPLSGLQRARIVALSKVGLNSHPVDWTAKLNHWYSGPVIRYQYKTEMVFQASNHASLPIEHLRMKPALVFSGIGHHKGFIDQLESMGVPIKADVKFPDHYTYASGDGQVLIKKMDQSNSEVCITTEKDMMRLMANPELVETFLNVHRVYYTRISVDIVDEEDAFLSMIDACVERKTA